MAVEEDQEMPLTEHIDELVTRLLVVMIMMAVVTVVTFFFSGQMLNILWENFLPGTPKRAYKPFAYILTRLKLSTLTGLAVAIPVLVYQMFMFMKPGLYENERRYFIAVVPVSVILLAVGLAFSYFIFLPLLFSYFRSYSDAIAEPSFGITETFNLILFLSLALGIVFQIPLLMFLAIKMRVTSREWLASKRIFAWIGFGTIGITVLGPLDPSGVSGFAVAGVMIFLYEVTLFLLRFTSSSKSRDKEGGMDDYGSPGPGGGPDGGASGPGSPGDGRASNGGAGGGVESPDSEEFSPFPEERTEETGSEEAEEPNEFDVVPDADADYEVQEEVEEDRKQEGTPDEIEFEESDSTSTDQDESRITETETETEYDLSNLQEVSGVGPAYEERLREAGVESIDELAQSDIEELSEETGVSQKRMSNWVQQAKEMTE